MRNLTDIYVRLSDEDRDKRCKADESESIQNQKSMLINYCIEQGWQIHNIYCDEDYSGADRNRPAFNQMLKDCEERKVDIVLCKTQSRFSRDMEIIEKYIHGKFIEWDVRFVSIVDHADTNVAGNKKARQINGLINEWYLEDLSDNIKKTLYHKKIKGEYCCPFAPYGYKLSPEDKHKFVVDPPAAEVVRSIFEMYKSGMGYIKIAKALNAKQIPPPSLYKTKQGINYRNPNFERPYKQQWRDSGVYYILRQEVYTGCMIQGKTKSYSYKNKKRKKLPKSDWIIVPDMHEPIIDKKLWDEVQYMIANHPGHDRSFKAPEDSEINPLRGIVYCTLCGAGMWRMSYKCAKQRYKYYRCRTVKTNRAGCDNINSVRQIDIEAVVLKELQELINRYFDPENIDLTVTSRFDEQLRSAEKEKLQMAKKIKELQAESLQLYRDKLKGLVSEEQFIFLNNTINEELQNANRCIEDVETKLNYLQGKVQNQNSKYDILKKYRNVDKLSFELVHELIEKIGVGKIDPATGKREIKIHWNF